MNALVLSLFPGIDLFGRAFEAEGFCVVRGPDLITGGDIRDFNPPEKKFDGVIGGPPCQDFSSLNRAPREYSYQMLAEYCRVIRVASPDWFLFENVAACPDFEIFNYHQQRFNLDLQWFTDFSRLRSFVFGSKTGALLDPMQGKKKPVRGMCVTGSDDRSFRAMCDIQGLPENFDLPFFNQSGKKQAVANGVPIPLGRYVANLIAATLYGKKRKAVTLDLRPRCVCGCGRVVLGRAKHAGAACRKRAQRARDASSSQKVTRPARSA